MQMEELRKLLAEPIAQASELAEMEQGNLACAVSRIHIWHPCRSFGPWLRQSRRMQQAITDRSKVNSCRRVVG